MSDESARKQAQQAIKQSVNPAPPQGMSESDKKAFSAEVKRQQELQRKKNG